jgi:hypothetical protein
MEWQQSDGRYTLQRGTCQATVWRNTDGLWVARIETQRYAPSIARFPVLEDAQAWVITELPNLHRAGECGEADTTS